MTLAKVFLGGFDVSAYVPAGAGVIVRQGRPNSTEQPSPANAIADLHEIPRPDLLTVGIPLWVNAAAPGTTEDRRIFTGTVSDIEATLAADGRTVHKIVAVSAGLGYMSQRRIGDEPWPMELDGERMARVLAAAGVAVGTIDPGTVYFVTRDVDSRNGLQVAQTFAAQAFGVLVDNADGSVSYQDAAYRDPADPPAAVIGAGELRSQPSASQRVGTVTNRVRIRYGPEPQDELRMTDDESIEQYGLFDKSWTTDLASYRDAEHIAKVLLNLYAQPRWGSEVVTLPLHKLPQPRAAELAALPLNVLVVITDSPAPLPESWPVWVEGIEDAITDDEWERSLLISDRYMAPVIDPPPPVDPDDCAAFDWPRLCSTANVFPTNDPSLRAIDPLWTPAEQAAWILNETDGRYAAALTLPRTAQSVMPFGLGVIAAAVGPDDGVHPDPWTGSADAPDFCIGHQGFIVEYLDDYPGSGPNAEWSAVQTPDLWSPAYVTPAPLLGWQWTPTDGWGTDDADWADGAYPPEWVGRQGCRVVGYTEYDYLYPGRTRRATKNGRWELVLTLLARGEEGVEMPSFPNIRMTYGLRVQWHDFRWARARF